MTDNLFNYIWKNEKGEFVLPQIEERFKDVQTFAKYKHEINKSEKEECFNLIQNIAYIAALIRNTCDEEDMDKKIYLIKYVNSVEELEIDKIIDEISLKDKLSRIEIERLLNDYYEQNHLRTDLTESDKMKRTIACEGLRNILINNCSIYIKDILRAYLIYEEKIYRVSKMDLDNASDYSSSDTEYKMSRIETKKCIELINCINNLAETAYSKGILSIARKVRGSKEIGIKYYGYFLVNGCSEEDMYILYKNFMTSSKLNLFGKIYYSILFYGLLRLRDGDQADSIRKELLNILFEIRISV